MELRDLRRTWTRWAPIYDLRVRLFLRWRAPAVEKLRLRPGDFVLDLACGTGLNFRLLRERVGPDGRVIGLDLTRAMLRRSQQRAASHDWCNISWLHTTPPGGPRPPH